MAAWLKLNKNKGWNLAGKSAKAHSKISSKSEVTQKTMLVK